MKNTSLTGLNISTGKSLSCYVKNYVCESKTNKRKAKPALVTAIWKLKFATVMSWRILSNGRTALNILEKGYPVEKQIKKDNLTI